MGHINDNKLSKLLGATVKFTDKCEICLQAKMTKRRSKEITIKPTIPLQKITSDLAGPITPPSLGGNKYVIFFLDAASRYIDFKLLKQKGEAYKAFIEYKTRAENTPSE